MGVNRTIYTQGAVGISGMNVGGAYPAWFLNNLSGGVSGGPGQVWLTGVQSANFTVNSPKVNVSSFGLLGNINKVQVEPQTAQLEVNLVINSGNHIADPMWLSGLVFDAMQPLPTGCVVTASGVGQVSGAVLTSMRFEASVGALSTLALTFDGVSGTPQVASSAPSVPNSITVPVVTPDLVTGLNWQNNSSGCAQTVRASWEFPVERILCLGTNINRPTIFSRPPGTTSFSVEGVDVAMLTGNDFINGIYIPPYSFLQPSTVAEVTRTANMAVGEAVSTYNITSEGVALGALVSG